MNWNDIRREYETTEVTLKALAEKYGVKDATIRSRKNREKWQRNVASNSESVATEKTPTKADKPKKNRGNPNPVKKFTKRNSAAMTHGLFAKHLPEEAQELINDLEDFDGADILWQQIKIQYAAIIRSQKIMWVQDAEDMTKEVRKQRESMDSNEVEYEVQFAWDKQASFLTAQSRAMSELRGLIKQFLEVSDDQDMRRLKVEKMQQDMRIADERLELDKQKAEGDTETTQESEIAKMLRGMMDDGTQH